MPGGAAKILRFLKVLRQARNPFCKWSLSQTRAKVPPHKEAQWFMVWEIPVAVGVGKCFLRILHDSHVDHILRKDLCLLILGRSTFEQP